MRTITRRLTLTALAQGICVATFRTVVAKESERSATQEAQRWMDKLISESRDPLGPLYLGRFADPMYFLTQPIGWAPNKGQERYAEVRVPAGFVTDLASIPRAFWSLLRPDGRYAYAAILHDYLYWTQTRSKGDSDMILKLGMEDFSVKKSAVTEIYEGVRLGGQRAWDDNARLKRDGEKRILKVYPNDPRTTWLQWKADASHFAEST